MNNAPAGWYPPDLTEPDELRYWDGTGWTDDVYTQVVSAPQRPSHHGAKVAIAFAAVAIAVVGFGAIATAVGTGAPTHSSNPHPISAKAQAVPAPAAKPSAEPSPPPSGSVTASAAPSTSATPSAEPSSSADTGTALKAALALTVKGRAPKTGYSRAEFGNAWVDVDRNGCDTRNDELRLRLTHKKMSGKCKVLSGDLADPYSNTTIHFERGGVSEVDVDHLVSMSDAWQKGAAKWPFAKRVAFANDPLNLEPVGASANRQKGDGDTATWLPANKVWRCDYVARQVAVKAKYQVWVTDAERVAMAQVLKTCPGKALPDFGAQPVIASNTGGPAPQAATGSAQDSPQTATHSELDPDYGTCKNAIAHGAGPYRSGKDAEYGWYRDQDKDGVVCE